ncbi:MAG TPA: FAD-dependent oxidoreductase [Bryobacteraceae bacterium]|nr:FAD-dependent oxidoreductase [Bryobacteraceae bacterium]
MSPDILVAGAGIIGTSIAWRLAQAGLRVCLLDAGKAGGEASWAGAGMLAPGGEVEDRSDWAEFALESRRLYPAFVAELAAESGCPIDFKELGAVEVAFAEAEWRALAERARKQAVLGVSSRCLSPVELRERVPLLGRETAGALWFPDDALVDPRQVMRALTACCRGRGVEIREGVRVTYFTLSPREALLETSAGPLTAGAAVLAAGAWSGEIPVRVNGAERPIPESFPVRGHLLGYLLDPGSLGPILRHGQTYLLQRANGLTIAGTSSEQVGFDRRLDRGIVRDIARRACELLPRLRAAGEPQPWLGFRPATAGLHPEIRRIEGAPLWLAYGHYRNGILLAPATAQRVSRQIIASSETDSQATAGTV